MSTYKHIIFDLDNTLYPKEIGLFKYVDERINRYLMEFMGFPPDEIAAIRRNYINNYGTTLRGLIIHHNVDADHYLKFVHDIPISIHIKKDPRLKRLLKNINANRVIFTNGSENYARKVLKALGVEEFFSRIFDIEFCGYKPKPYRDSYEKVLRALDVDGSQCIMVDDIEENLIAAKEFGILTILVGDGNSHSADFSLKNLYEIEPILNEILIK
ncbi:MAG: pyrimidine 5'-nucleotidase [Candidatus Aenigmatarchaeota archaeon]